MVWDPNKCEVHHAAKPELPEGHYAFRADIIDPAPVIEAPVDPIELARREAFEATVRLNLLPREERTPEAVAEVDALSGRVHELSSQANEQLIARRLGGPEAV